MLMTLAKFIRPYAPYLALALLGALGETAADLLQPWPLKILFDNILRGEPLPPAIDGWLAPIFGQGASGLLAFAVSAVLAIAVVRGASSFMQDFFMPRVGHFILHDLRRQLYWHIQRLSMTFHDEGRVGELLSTLTTDIQVVRDLVESALVGLVVNTLTLLGMIIIMLVIDWRLALLALSIAPFLFVIVYRFTHRMKAASRDARRQEGVVASVAQEVLTSMRAVQAFTREDYEQARFERENEQRVWAGIRARTLAAQLDPLVEVLVAIGSVLVLWYGTQQVLNGTLTPGSLLVFIAYLGGLYKPMRKLSKEADVLSRAAVGLERIVGILETGQTVKDLPGAKVAPTFRGRIQFENVFFSYRPREPVLKDLSCAVEPGQVIALVGATGAGKTTLIRLISRFNDPDRGRIRIDGEDIRNYTLSSLRAQISLVLQETILFYGTVRDNIAYGRGPSRRTESSLEARDDSVLRDGPRQHRQRSPGGDVRRGRRRGENGQRSRVHRAIARRLRDDDRSAGGRAFRRSAPAPHHCSGGHSGCADRPARRAHHRTRRELRGAGDGGAGSPRQRAHGRGDRPSPHHGESSRFDPRPRERTHRGERHPRAIACDGRSLRRAL